MLVGHLQQKASGKLVGFVFGCIIMIIVLLYFTVKTETIADSWGSQNVMSQN